LASLAVMAVCVAVLVLLWVQLARQPPLAAPPARNVVATQNALLMHPTPTPFRRVP
jgi:hypothetical protein